MNVSFLRWTSVAWGAGAGVAACTVALFACGGSDSGSGSKVPPGSRSEVITHEPCDETGKQVTVLDANGDKKPDIRRVYDKSTGKEVCSITDFNFDDKPDLFQYYDAAGQLRRREADYNGDGVVDAIEYYENGKLVRRELDIADQHRLDTWDFFDPASGQRTRRERDSDGDGRVDQWWTWNGDQVTIAFDKNNDGKPDPEDTMTLSASGSAITTSAQLSDAGADAGLISTAASLGVGLYDAGVANAVAPSAADVAPLLPGVASRDAGAPKAGVKTGGKAK